MRRAVGAIVRFVLVGAAVNVAVAWGCALWSPIFLDGVQRDIRPDRRIVSLIPPPWLLGGSYVRAGAVGVSVHVVMVAAVQAPRSDGFYVSRFSVVECGWPLTSMECRSDLPAPGSQTPSGWSGAIKRPALLRPGNGDYSLTVGGRGEVLPLRPRWGGFVVNTVVFGAACWMLMGGVARARRWRRAREGRCVGCGYPVRGLETCPECGAVPDSVSAEQESTS